MHSHISRDIGEAQPERPRQAKPVLAIVLLSIAVTICLRAQTDDFDDGNDLGWSKITATNFPATYSFPSDAFGGKAYRLQGGVPAGTIGEGLTNTARAVAYRADRLYTNFFVAADVVGWNTSFTNDQIFGLMARANDVGDGLASAITFVVRPADNRSVDGVRGPGAILSLMGGSLAISDGNYAAFTANANLVAGRGYRFVFFSTNSSPTTSWYVGQVFDLEDLTRPLISIAGDNALSDLFGMPFPASGYSGVFNLALETDTSLDLSTDTTFDNFLAAELLPVSVAPPGTPHGLSGVAQVVSRSPLSYANFHPPTNGISFLATTLTTTNNVNLAAIKLFLNEVDVSSALTITGPATNASVSYIGLTANTVYDARIELEDAIGRRTTNRWTFDTFSDAYLAASSVKVIECEDYDFNNGEFIDNPPASGYATNDTLFSNPINGNGVGYLDLVGSNAKLGGTDFFDYDSGTHTQENEFRNADSVGTAQGSLDMIHSDGNDFSIYVYDRVYDTQRQKYASLDPALQEYIVRRTEGGEWLNYTRTFSSSNYYNVYLRAGCALGQRIDLAQLPNTNSLGTFTVPGALTLNNFRNVPLLGADGKLAVINLSGTNTLRLTMASAQSNATKQGLALNYLAFVPALQLESAAVVTGPYSLESTASVNPAARRIVVPAGNSVRFYRLRWDQPTRITTVQFVGGNVELTYE